MRRPLPRRAALATLGAGTAWLAGCATGPAIDTRYSAAFQGPRVDLLVLHYTALDFPTSLRVLTQQVVSSHYLVDVDPPTIYRLVDEDRRANHAGVSGWDRRTLVNTSSIGIEIVNLGRVRTPDGQEVYTPYPDKQIDAVIVLVRDIVKRWGIPPERVVGHADVAPGRKQDPGPLFPWKRLAAEGLAVWYDEGKAAALRPHFEKQLPELAWFQQRLARFGYLVPLASAPGGGGGGSGSGSASAATAPDKATQDVLVSFQMRFRPSRYDGLPDAETAAILAALTGP